MNKARLAALPSTVPPKARGLTALSPQERLANSKKANIAKAAKKLIIQQLSNNGTVSSETRDKFGILALRIVSKIDAKLLKITNIKDFKILVDACDTIHGWSAKDAPKQHLHLHTVGKLMKEVDDTGPQAVVEVSNEQKT